MIFIVVMDESRANFGYNNRYYRQVFYNTVIINENLSTSQLKVKFDIHIM